MIGPIGWERASLCSLRKRWREGRRSGTLQPEEQGWRQADIAGVSGATGDEISPVAHSRSCVRS